MKPRRRVNVVIDEMIETSSALEGEARKEQKKTSALMETDGE